MAIELGYFTMPVHPPERDYVQTLKEDREAILLADRLGFTEAYVGEHVTDVAESITDCTVFLASLAHVTKQIKLGTGTVNLPNGHPAAIATKVAMLDNILEGRFLFGISPGGLPSDWEMFGNLDADRREKFAESIDLILGIWEGDAPYNLEGKHWTISTERTQIPEIGQGRMVKPYQKPHPPIVVTVVEPFSASAANAAARGWDVISANFLLPQWVKSHWEKVVEGCEAAGRTPDPARWRVAKTVFVADDERTAREYGFGPGQPVPLLLPAARLQARSRRPRQPLQAGSGSPGLGRHDGLHRRPARRRRHGRPGRRRAAGLPRDDRRLRDAPLLRHRLGRPATRAALDGAHGRGSHAPGQPRDRAGSRGGPGGRLTAFPRSATLAEV